MTELKDWLALISLAIAVGASLYTWLTQGSKTNAADVADMKKQRSADMTHVEQKFDEVEKEARKFGEAIVQRFQMQEQRIAVLNEAIEHVPDREQSHRLELAIEKLTGRMETLDQRMTGRIETLDERLKPVSAISDRLQEFLLEQARSK